MFTLCKTFTFEASHVLPSHDGKCARLHGHSWKGQLIVRGEELQSGESNPKAGMLVDYGDLKRSVTWLVEGYLDHYHLNDSTGLTNPTSEELARWCFHKLKANIPLLIAVVIEETCTSQAMYRP